MPLTIRFCTGLNFVTPLQGGHLFSISNQRPSAVVNVYRPFRVHSLAFSLSHLLRFFVLDIAYGGVEVTEEHIPFLQGRSNGYAKYCNLLTDSRVEVVVHDR